MGVFKVFMLAVSMIVIFVCLTVTGGIIFGFIDIPITEGGVIKLSGEVNELNDDLDSLLEKYKVVVNDNADLEQQIKALENSGERVYRMNVPEWNEFTKYHLQTDTTNLDNVLLSVTGDTYTFYIGDNGVWLTTVATGMFDGAYEREEFQLLVDKYFNEGD